MLAAALLHDVVEDTPVTIEEVENLFGKNIAEWLKVLLNVTSLKKKNLMIKALGWKEKAYH